MRTSASISEPVRVKSVVSAATVSNTVTASRVPNVGASLTAFTTRVILFEKVPPPSVTLSIKLPIVSCVLLTFSLGVKIKPSNSEVLKESPTTSNVPSAREIVPPVGRASTVMDKESPSTSVNETLNDPAVSSSKEKELTSKVGSSLTAEMLKVRVAVVPSDAVIVRELEPFKLATVEKLIFESWAEVSCRPFVRTVPSEAVRVIPSGIVPIEIVTLESLGVIEKVPDSSSVKLKLAFVIEATGVGSLLPPPPPPPQEANVNAAKFAKIKDDFPFNCIT